ncbi:UNVERIFIED_ORG: hypothetical protein J2W19_003198 [Shinella zoogloeoides]|nr:hypothetical protein [Shinella zoogloeoides]
MSDLSSLIARLEKAEGPDRELDARICWALCLEPWAGTEEILLSHFSAGSRIDRETPAFTSSIDAAVSLAERVLPGHQVNVTRFTSTMARASIGNRWLAAENHKTPALALVLATLRALDQKGGTE